MTSGVFSRGKGTSTVRIPEVQWHFAGLMKDYHEAAQLPRSTSPRAGKTQPHASVLTSVMCGADEWLS